MKTIVVPLDGSELAEQALPLASAIAGKEDAGLILATAILVDDKWVNEEIRRLWEAEEQAGVEAYVKRIATRLRSEGVRAVPCVEWGHPQVVIQEIADREGADLIVMTTHGRSGVSRWTMGSVADKVLRTTSTPLILIHPTTHGRPPTTVKRVIVALDGSELAETAVPAAEQFARAMDASMLLVRAVVPPTTLYAAEFALGAMPVLGKLEAQAEEYLEETAAPIRKRGLEVATSVAVGIPAEVILAASPRDAADMIVMTTHGRSGLNRWMFGSVADAVVRHGDVPVLVIRSWPTLAEEEREEIPVAGSAVVPPPLMTETGPRARPVTPRRTEVRPHRPERSPGR